ncbi:MAG: FAD-dependent oxidoreductase, partial [Bacteroidales bacterium]|nr:FAD-dependent oxidoreductase [Bacteroidales bacterium]
RCFSLQSSPNEKNAKITYAVKGEFTIQMEKQLNIGTEVWLKLPYGELFEHKHDKNKTVFIAGGTGVTPFLSLFTDQSFLVYENPKIYLGFRSKEYNIYQSALNKMMEIRENLSTMLQIRYENEVGIIDINEIFEQNGTDANYFISGPPIMIKLFRQKLIEKGVSDINILTDDWE